MRPILKCLVVIGCLALTACANVNDQLFDGQIYKLEVATLDNPITRLYYMNRNDSNQKILIERDRIFNLSLSEFSQKWLKREQEYRRNDCRLTHHTYQQINYALCRYTHRDVTVIYTFAASDKKNYADTKVYIALNKAPSENKVQEIAVMLHKFNPLK